MRPIYPSRWYRVKRAWARYDLQTVFILLAAIVGIGLAVLNAFLRWDKGAEMKIVFFIFEIVLRLLGILPQRVKPKKTKKLWFPSLVPIRRRHNVPLKIFTYFKAPNNGKRVRCLTNYGPLKLRKSKISREATPWLPPGINRSASVAWSYRRRCWRSCCWGFYEGGLKNYDWV